MACCTASTSPRCRTCGRSTNGSRSTSTASRRSSSPFSSRCSSVCTEGLRMGAVRLGLLLLTLYMTLSHLRQELVIAVMAPLLLADPMRRALEPTWPKRPVARLAWPPRRQLAAAVAAGWRSLFAIPAAWRVINPEVRGNGGRRAAHSPPARPAGAARQAGVQRLQFRRLAGLQGRAAVHGRPLRHVWRQAPEGLPGRRRRRSRLRSTRRSSATTSSGRS